MEMKDIPFNITLLNLDQNNRSAALKKVTSTGMFGSAKQSFDVEGLWSEEIFGNIGHEARSKMFGYIDIKVKVIHPIVYGELVSMKRLYGEIMSGETYAKWDSNEKEFVRSNPLEGRTGYKFFMDYYMMLEIKDTGSRKRQQFIRLFNKYKEKALIDKIVVMPAGLRDVETDNGRVIYDDVNGLYRKLISLANNISPMNLRNEPELLNATRFSLQKAFNELYEHLLSLVKGKKKFFLGKFASRKVFNGTANVITATVPSGRFMGNPDDVGYNDIVYGLYQGLKGALPFAIGALKESFLASIFTDPNDPVKLVNKKSLKEESLMVSSDYFDLYRTDEGLEKIINKYEDQSNRHKPIEIEGRYLALMYKGPDNTFRIISSINEIPEDRDVSDVEPLTLCQLLYVVCQKFIHGKPSMCVRYPITGTDSTVIGKVYLKTTVKAEVRHELDSMWEIMEDGKCTNFPVTGSDFINSMSPPVATLSGLNADFDGDRNNGNIVYTKEAIEETTAYLNSKRAHVSASGQIRASVDYDTTKFVFHNLTL